MVIVLLALMSMLVQANDWSEPITVTEIIAGYKEGYILFRTSGSYKIPNSCELMYRVDSEFANVELSMAILLASQKSQTKIKVGVDPVSCAGNAIKVIKLSSL